MSTSQTAAVPCDIKDLSLAERGKRRIDWAFQSMTALQTIRKQFIKAQPFANIRISACLNITAETANLMITLRDAGANSVLCAANPLSTQDDVAASLVKDYSIPVYAIRGESAGAYRGHIETVLDNSPQITLDDGGELISALHRDRPEQASALIGGTEETTTGSSRLRALARDGKLQCPVVAVNDSATKQLFDNCHGTGQSTLDAILRVTNLLFAGLNVVVLGFGSCGRGIALRARGLGASVMITEVDPIRGLTALMEGFRVASLSEAAALGDVFITATGNRAVIGREHFERFKNGAILCNAGHSNVEIDLETLSQISSSHRAARESMEEFHLRDGRRIYVLGDGRPINLAAAEGHPASVMDISFANQALSAEYLLKHRGELQKNVYRVPAEIDRQIARIKLESMGVKVDRLTLDQEQYLSNWSEGT